MSSWSLGDAVGRLVERGVLKVLDHPTVQAVVEQGQPVVAVLDAARECALSNVDDEAARAELQQRLPDDREVVDRAVHVLADRRRNYRDDRAYRILHACLNETAVQAIEGGGGGGEGRRGEGWRELVCGWRGGGEEGGGRRLSVSAQY